MMNPYFVLIFSTLISNVAAECTSDFCGEEFTTSLSIVVMVTFIIGFSVFMEQCVMDPLKEAPEENPNLEPIVNTMFSELTLLGFVGLGMFIVEKLDLLSGPSYRIFHDKETLAELFEAIHMTLFLVMILFLFNAFCLLQMGKKTSKRWKHANVRAIDEKEEIIKEYAEYLRSGKRIPEDLEFTLSFMGIRDRFIKNHSGGGKKDVEEGKKEKKKVVKKKDEVPHDFELNEYFSSIMGKKAGEIIEVPVSTWIILEIILIVIWFVKLPCTNFQFSIFFIFLGYLMMFVSYLVDGHLKDVLSELIPAKHYEAARKIAFDSKIPDELTSLTSSSGESSKMKEQKYESIGAADEDSNTKKVTIPPFMMRSMQEIQKQHSGLSKFIFGRVPNRHEALFFGGSKGHDVLMQVVRIIALGSAIYLAIFVIVMINPILDRFGHDYAILVLILILAAIPVFVNFYALNVLVADFVIVSSVELMRDTKTIQIVKRTMVTKKAMIALKLLNSMRTALKSSGKEVTEIKKASEIWPDPHVRHEKEREMRELFDMFDTDQSGFIDEEEMNHLLEMQRIGDKDSRKRVFQLLDQDGGGEISFEEFFDWIATQAEEEEEEIDEEKVEELAKQLFDLIDTPDENGDRDGVITPLEFFRCVESLCSKSGKMELSLEDIEAMFREVDEDGDGDLDLEEFEGMLKKYMFED